MVRADPGEPVSCDVLCFADAAEYVRIRAHNNRAAELDSRQVDGGAESQKCSEKEGGDLLPHARGSDIPL